MSCAAYWLNPLQKTRLHARPERRTRDRLLLFARWERAAMTCIRRSMTTIRSREGGGVEIGGLVLSSVLRSLPSCVSIERYVGRVPSAHLRTTSLSTPAASCRCRSMWHGTRLPALRDLMLDRGGMLTTRADNDGSSSFQNSATLWTAFTPR